MGTGENWVHWEPAVGQKGLRYTHPGCIQCSLTKLKPGLCNEGHKQKWKREHAETERKEVSEDQFVTSLLTFVITHRKCEEKVQEVGYLPWAAANSPSTIGIALVSCTLGTGWS